MQLKRRITSVVLSAAMIAGNLVTPFTAYAGEIPPDMAAEVQTDTSADEAAPPETSQPETDAPDFTITLPDQEAFGLMYDQTHFLSEDKEKKETVLSYKQGEEVNLDVVVNPDYQLDKLAFQDQNISIADYQKKQGKEYPFTWKDEDTLTFTMPDSDLWMVTEWHQLQTEPTTAASEAQPQTTVETQAAAETQTAAETNAPDDAANETSANADDTAELGQTAGPAAEQGGQASAQTEVSQNQTDSGENDGVPETQDTSSTIQTDGFPAQGALLMLPEKQIGIDVTDIAEETRFDDVTYPQDTCSSKLQQACEQ